MHADGAEETGRQRPISGSQIVAIETVLDYIVATYGRAAFGRLVAALGHHDDWQSLIAEVFGIPSSEFEAGRLAYLAAQYAGDDPALYPLAYWTE